MAWDLDGNAKTVVRGGYGIFYQQINGETTHAAEGPWRGTTSLRQGRIEDPFGSLGQTEPPPASPGRFGCSAAPGFPGLRVHAVSDTDSNRVHGPESPDDLHASCKRVAAASAHAQFRRRGFVHRQDRQEAGGTQFLQRRAVRQFARHRGSNDENIEERVPFSPGIISAASRVLGNFFRSEYHSLQLRAERRMARSFSGSLCRMPCRKI